MNDIKNNENKELVKLKFDEWKNDKGTLFDILNDNVTWTVSGKGDFSGVYKGKKDFMDRAVIPINEQLTTKIQPELGEIIAEGDTVWIN